MGVTYVVKRTCCDIGPVYIVTLLEELCTYKKPYDVPMRRHLDKVQMLCNKLEPAGLPPFDDRVIVALMLKSLPIIDKYGSIVEVMGKDHRDLSVKNVKSRLLLEDEKEQLEKEKKIQGQKSLRTFRHFLQMSCFARVSTRIILHLSGVYFFFYLEFF